MDCFDEALQRFERTGPEFGGGLSNHGPMAVEALVRLGFEDAIPGWVSGYLPRLEDRPGAGGRIANWREALGDQRRVGDWTAYFEHRLTEAAWRDVLAEWWPRLVPGLAAGATHGVIRTAHAVRGMAELETGTRRAELAHALAYWAAAYHELPGTPRTAGRRSLEAAVAALPALAGPRTGLIKDNLGALATVPEFAGAVTALRPPVDVQAETHELARTFAGVFLARGRRAPITFLHAVTAPVAVASVLGELPVACRRPTYDALWQVTAAIHSAYSAGTTVEPPPSHDPPSAGDLAEQAVANGDEHAIKLTEACLREHTRTADPVFLHAAARGIELLG
jgi:hypothetical protein